jgi:hypothetical protein
MDIPMSTLEEPAIAIVTLRALPANISQMRNIAGSIHPWRRVAGAENSSREFRTDLFAKSHETVISFSAVVTCQSKLIFQLQEGVTFLLDCTETLEVSSPLRETSGTELPVSALASGISALLGATKALSTLSVRSERFCRH